MALTSKPSWQNGLPNGFRTLWPWRLQRTIESVHREIVFRWGMHKYLRQPETYAEPGARFDDLIYGWGNEWSAREEFLTACIAHALNTRGPILECGSGLSTLLVGAIAKRQGRAHWVFEHSADWADKTQRYLDSYGLDSVVLCVTPLIDYGEYSWYELPSTSLPDDFALVICDGPPGATKGGRFGLVPRMGSALKPGCVILLDDAYREAEQLAALRWQSILGASIDFIGHKKPFIQMTVTGARQPLTGIAAFDGGVEGESTARRHGVRAPEKPSGSGHPNRASAAG